MDKVFKPGPNRVFVFGSNTAGIHGAGAAATAFHNYGAKWAQGEGLQGDSYAIPTKDSRLRTLPVDEITFRVDRFLEFARQNPQLYFFVTRIGCGFAGYTDKEMAPLFRYAPSNCELPYGWENYEQDIDADL